MTLRDANGAVEELEQRFWNGMAARWQPDHDNSGPIADTARSWMDRKEWLAATIAYQQALQSGWGVAPDEVISRYAYDGIRCALNLNEASPEGAIEVIIGLQVARSLSRRLMPWRAPNQRNLDRELGLMLAKHLSRAAEAGSNQDGYLIRGFQVGGRIVGPWGTYFPEDGIDPSSPMEMINCPGLAREVPGAFHVLMEVGDHEAAAEIARSRASAFALPRLEGWRHAALAFTTPGEEEGHFAAAAEAFAADTNERAREANRGWTSINVMTWAPYFRARAALAQLAREPHRADELLESANRALEPTRDGWMEPNVGRLRILVRAVADLLTDGDLCLERIRDELQLNALMEGTNEDDWLCWRCVEGLTGALRGFREDPAAEVASTRLATAVGLIGQMSVLSSNTAPVLQRRIGECAIDMVTPPSRTWVHTTLERVRDERVLHRLLLRLFQDELPLYSHITHGPVEYGKDLVVIRREGARTVMTMYQVKVGNVSLSRWPDLKAQLEMMLQVPYSPPESVRSADEVVGVLVLNGHMQPHAVPAVNAWLSEQRGRHQRSVQVMSLDELAGMIVDRRKFRTFRAACNENGVGIAS